MTSAQQHLLKKTNRSDVFKHTALVTCVIGLSSTASGIIIIYYLAAVPSVKEIQIWPNSEIIIVFTILLQKKTFYEKRGRCVIWGQEQLEVIVVQSSNGCSGSEYTTYCYADVNSVGICIQRNYGDVIVDRRKCCPRTRNEKCMQNFGLEEWGDETAGKAKACAGGQY